MNLPRPSGLHPHLVSSLQVEVLSREPALNRHSLSATSVHDHVFLDGRAMTESIHKLLDRQHVSRVDEVLPGQKKVTAQLLQYNNLLLFKIQRRGNYSKTLYGLYGIVSSCQNRQGPAYVKTSKQKALKMTVNTFPSFLFHAKIL